ncbi:MATE family efflux transporter [Telmatocola sphagniphila]|uniref:Multidrug-efflux transporter n=1 Tax=Telmatocola sphagniphila TaxID=1123043 RepID=A0A8E6ERY3_9BACT|nr:MATE family efflux transporter [Telmatocola sphagniphila]QVL29824.1 MATE family efflux transporter [Telmatocola sphagniphila]
MQASSTVDIVNARPGGIRELLSLAWPLIISSSFSTIQITVDRAFAAQLGTDAASATTTAAMFFWTPFILLFSTSGYVSTFVAQYKGAGRPHKIGPIVWQGIYFSAFLGIAILSLIPFRAHIFAMTGHTEQVQQLECDFFGALCWMGLPALLTSVTCAFFSGLGNSRTVIWINVAGTIVNGLLDYAWVLGGWGFTQLGVAGAGWATTAASWVSALIGLALMFRKKYRMEFDLLVGWHFCSKTFLRLMRFGLPSGVQWFLDMTAFASFLSLTGRFGEAELAASSLAYTINNFAFIPMFGLSQAVSILVGQRLGENRPQIAEKSVRNAFVVCAIYMCTVVSMYSLFPSFCAWPFQDHNHPENWAAVFAKLKVLFYFIGAFAIFDSMTLMFSGALRGAGDTLYVTLVSLSLAWPVMVLPTYLAVQNNWGLNWAWSFLSLYVALQGLFYFRRFHGGKWKAMRVIEPEVID